MGRLFGTDGVRGIANKELTPELCFNLGKAGAYILSQDKKDKPLFIIGRDTRISGNLLEAAMAAGVMAVGGNVINLGVVPTPAVAHLVRRYGATAGVVISASHNPFEYNGIKFFNSEGFKLDDTIEDAIEDILVRNIDVNNHVTGEKIGFCKDMQGEAVLDYLGYILESTSLKLEGKKIVIDCAHGATYKLAPMVYGTLGADLILIGAEPNGININKGYGSTHTEKLAKEVVKNGALLGMAYDGDGDRLIVVDEKGSEIDGDKIICICASFLKKKGNLPGDLVTTTVMSNMGFHKYIESIGCRVKVTNVGDRYVLEDMLKTGSKLGGEQSGHIIFLEHGTTGDGLLSSLQFLEAVLEDGRPLSEIVKDIPTFPQVLKNARVENKNKNLYKEDKDISAKIKEVEEKLSDNGRLLIRPSGTEPLVRVMIEGENQEEITAMAETLAILITKKLG